MPNPTDAAELKAIWEDVDATRRDVELTWGAERLPILVGPDWRVKLRRQQAKFTAALEAAWKADVLTVDAIGDVRSHAEAMKRGWRKLEEIAAEAGHRPQSPGVLAERLLPDGSVCAIVRDNDAAAQVNAEGRAVSVYTLDEVFTLIGELVPESLALAKVHFPGARFTAASPLPDVAEWDVGQGEAIPFPVASGAAA